MPGTSSSYDAIVIGAGINGLSAAAYLAKAGKRVLVVDQRNALGGATTTEELIPGFHFDAVSSDPGWLAPRIVEELGLQHRGLVEMPSVATVTTPLLDAPALTLRREMRRTITGLREHSKHDPDKWSDFSAQMTKLAGFLATLYTVPALRPLASGRNDLLDVAQAVRRLRGLGKTDMVELLRIMPMSVAELLDDTFESDVLKATIGAAGITGLHQGPRSAGTTFVMLHHHVGREPGEFRMRRRFRGGVGALAKAFAAAARAAGAEIRLNTRVTAIVTREWVAHGVVLENGDEIGAGSVVSSADAATTLIDLCDVAQLDPELVRALRRVRGRGVVARVHLALDRLPSFAGLADDALRGIISIAPDLNYLERAYDDAKYGRVSQRPYLEVTIPSLMDQSVAPDGKHTVSISMQYAPYTLRNGGWNDAQREAIGDVVMKTLAEYAPDLPDAVIDRRVLTPVDLERDYGLLEGNFDYAELGLDQILFMRPVPECARYATPIERLFLCGAGTHPGRAVAGSSGRLAARTLLSL